MPPPHQVSFVFPTSRLSNEMYTSILDHSWGPQFPPSKTNEVIRQIPACLKQTEAGEQANADGQREQERTSILRGVVGTRAKGQDGNGGVGVEEKVDILADPRTANTFQQKQEESAQKSDLQIFQFLQDPSSL